MKGNSRDKEKEREREAHLNDSGITQRGSGDKDQAGTPKDKRRVSTKNLMADYGDEETLRAKLSQLKDKRKKSIYSSQVQFLLQAFSFLKLNF